MPPAPASLGVEREGMWLSEKARRSCREEVGEGKEEERKKGCRNGVDELRSNILLPPSLLRKEREDAEMPLRPRDLIPPRVFIYIAASHHSTGWNRRPMEFFFSLTGQRVLSRAGCGRM